MAKPFNSVATALGKKSSKPKSSSKASSMSIGGAKAPSAVADMLSRPSRPHRSGYKKTSEQAKSKMDPMKLLASLAAPAMPQPAMPPMGGGGALPI